MNNAIVFTGVMLTIVSLGAIFWVGAQCWQVFVLAQSKLASEEQAILQQQIVRRFDSIFALPLLLLIALAHVGVLFGQVVLLVGGQWSALSTALVVGLLTHNSIGIAWIVEEAIIILAILLYALVRKQQTSDGTSMLSRLKLLLGIAFLLSMAVSEQVVNPKANINVLIYTSLIDWLHLVAFALWLGCAMYIALVYLPLVNHHSQQEQLATITALLPRYTRLAVIGIILSLSTALLMTVIYQGPWTSPFATQEGRLLLLEALWMLVLLGMSGFALFRLLPHQLREYSKYQYAATRMPESVHDAAQVQAALRSQRLLGRNQSLTSLLRYTALPAIGLLICAAFFTTLTYPTHTAPSALPVSSTSPSASKQAAPTTSFSTTLPTVDHQFTIQLTVTPDSFGPNVFTVHVLDGKGAPASNVRVSLVVTMLDMDMGSDTVTLQSSGPGVFSGPENLDMNGHWGVRVVVHTPDNAIHEANVTLTVS